MAVREEVKDLTAQEAFALLTIDDLKPLAKFITHAIPARKTELVALLTETMLNPRNLREYYAEQDEIGQAAIREATHHPRGLLDAIRFEAKYGRMPRFHQAKDADPDDQFFGYNYGGKPTKLRLFFPRLKWLPRDMRELLRDFVAPPEAARITGPTELPATVKPVWLSRDSFWARGEKKELNLSVRLTAASAQQEVKAMLRLVESGQVKVGAKTQKPSQATLEAVTRLLSDGDYYQAEDADEYESDPGADLTIKPFAWCMLLQAAGWTTLASGKLNLSDAGRKALQEHVPTLLKHAWRSWLANDLFDEFSRVNIIKGQQSHGGRVMTAIPQRRLAIFQTLQHCPIGGWIAIDEFFRQIILGPGLQLCHDPWELYLFEKEYGSFGYDGTFTFETLEGRYIMAFLFEYAATLGLIDIAYIPPSGARNEFHERWGADDLSCLSRYDGLQYFRINPLGAWILGLAATYVPEQVEAVKSFKVLPNRDIVAESNLPAADVLFLDRFAKRQSDQVWHLEREKILSTVAQGGAVTEVSDYLRAKSSVGVPETVETFLQDLHCQATLLKDKGTARLIECADEHTAALLSSDRKMKGKLKRAGETWLVFAPEHEAEVRRQLKALGYVLPPQE